MNSHQTYGLENSKFADMTTNNYQTYSPWSENTKFTGLTLSFQLFCLLPEVDQSNFVIVLQFIPGRVVDLRGEFRILEFL